MADNIDPVPALVIVFMAAFRLLQCCPVSEGVRGRFAELASARADLSGVARLIWFLVALVHFFRIFDLFQATGDHFRVYDDSGFHFPLHSSCSPGMEG